MGPAAYLVSAGKDGHVDTRAMGAAIVTVIVEESVAEELSRAARERSARWEQHDFSEALQQAYLSIVGS